MSPSSAIPFVLRRSSDVIGTTKVTTTKETVHGLLRLEDDRLVVQWRLERRVDHVGSVIRSDSEMEPVQEVVIPLRGVAGARVRTPWWRFGRGGQLVLTAADLLTFEGIAGQKGLNLSHPAELVLGIRRKDRLAAVEFAADLELALAERALRLAEGGGGPGPLNPGTPAGDDGDHHGSGREGAPGGT